MKHLKLFEDYILESVKFKFSYGIESALDGLNNSKSLKLEKLVVKKILNKVAPSYISMTPTVSELIKEINYANFNTQQKLDFLFKHLGSEINNNIVRKLISIKDYLINDNNITSNDFDELYTISANWHKEKAKNTLEKPKSVEIKRLDETPNTDIFITYPNGWYWINLNTSFSSDEASNMGHCGNDTGRTLFSLRDNNKNSRITISYEYDDKAMCQCKGRGNTKPSDEYHPYILDFLKNEKYPVNNIFTGVYKPQLDFNFRDLTEEEREDLIETKPSLEYTDSMFEAYIEDKKWDRIVSMIENGYVYNGYEEDKKFIEDISFLRFLIENKLNIKKYEDEFKPLMWNITEEDLDFYLTHFPEEIGSFVTLEVWTLWKHKKISDEETLSRVKELVIEDDIWYIKWDFKNWGDFNFMFDKNDGGGNSYSSSEYVKKIVSDQDTFYSNDYDYNLNDCDLSELTNDTVDAILNKIEEDEIELEEDEIEELIESDDDFGFETHDGYSFDILKNTLLTDDDNRNKLETILEFETMEEIRKNIIYGYEDAKADADYNDMFKAFEKPILKFLNMEKLKWYQGEGDFLLFEFDINWLHLLYKTHPSDGEYRVIKLSKVIEDLFNNGVREDSIDEEGYPEFFELNIPYYGWNGDVEAEYLNERVRERLQM